MQTAVEWLVEQIKLTYDKEHRLPIAYILSLTEEAKEMEREIAISFHKWMQINDTEQNAEKYANYSDEDMFDEFLK